MNTHHMDEYSLHSGVFIHVIASERVDLEKHGNGHFVKMHTLDIGS